MIIKLSENRNLKESYSVNDFCDELNSTIINASDKTWIGEPINGLEGADTLREIIDRLREEGYGEDGDTIPEEVFIEKSGFDPDRTYRIADNDYNAGANWAILDTDSMKDYSKKSDFGSYGTYKGLKVGWYAIDGLLNVVVEI